MASICNFCLTMSNTWRLVDELMKETIDLIFINVEFVTTESSVICGECIRRIRLAFDLKSASICNEDLVVSYYTNKPRSGKLIEVYLEKSKLKCDFIPNELKICRICISAVSDNNFCILEDIVVATNVRDIISTHLPEVDFTVTNQPIICSECLRKLQDYGRFINSWLDIYNLKKSYCLANNKTDISDLNDLRNYIFGINIDAQPSDIHKRNRNNIKTETFTIQEFENGEQRIEENRECIVDNVEIKDEIKVYESKYAVKELQLKTDSVEKLKHVSEILHFGPKMVSNDDRLEKMEISIYSERHLDTQSLSIDNRAEKRNEKNIECMVDEVEIKEEINVHELEYPVEGLQIKPDSISCNVQLRNNVLYRSGHFEREKSKQNTDILHFEPKIEPDDYLLKQEEIFIDDFSASEEHFENVHSQILYIENQGFEQQKSDECSSFSKREVLMEPMRKGIVVPSFNLKYLSKNKQPNLEENYKAQRISTNSTNMLIKINDGFKCSICPFENQAEAEVQAHIENYHYHKDSRQIQDQDQIVDEMISDEFEKPYEIELSNYSYRANKTSHKPTYRVKSLFHKCRYCEYNTQNRNILLRHIASMHSAVFTYQCQQCDFQSEYIDIFKSHVTKHLCKFYNYKQCDFKSKYHHNFKSHLMKRSVQLNECKLCGFKAKNTRDFGLHSSKSYKCEQCDYITQCINDFRMHKIKLHKKSTLKSKVLGNYTKVSRKFYRCQECDFKTRYRDSFKSHLIQHTIQFHVCELCGFETTNTRDFGLHSSKSYKCEQCDYISQCINDFRVHKIRLHDKFTLKSNVLNKL